MEIEEPEVPIDFPVHALMAISSEPFGTIGAFYRAIMNKLKVLGKGAFNGDPGLQLAGAFSQATPINTLEDALAGLELIVEQGEGTESTPLSSLGGAKAHFYRFKEIRIGKTLTADPNSPQGFSYGDPPIIFDSSQIEEMVSDPQIGGFTGKARDAVNDFNTKYSRLLDDLHTAFNGDPNSFDPSSMSELFQLGKQVIAITDPVHGKKATPSFEYVS